MDSGFDPAAFADTARRAVAACAGLDGRAQAARLAEDGLLGILAPEEAGGLGLGLGYAVPVMEAAGAGLLAFPLMETLLLARALPAQAEAIASGGMIVTVAWAGIAPGTVGRAPCADASDAVLVRTAEGAALVRRADCTLHEAPTLDVDAPEFELTPTGAPPLATLSAEGTDQLWSDALVLRAAAMLGAASTCLALATEHVSQRQQFGRTLVSFQALRHALARQKLGIESIRATLDRALVLEGAAGRQARRVAFSAACAWGPAAVESALQLHGGMGFTWDIPVHRHLRQARTREAQGDVRAVRGAIADALLDANG